MEIEAKEKDSIEALIGQKWEEMNNQLRDSGGVNPSAFRLGFLSANTHLQKEVIQPLRDDLKSLQERQPEINREALSVAIAEAEEEFEVKNKQYVTELESNLYKLEVENKALREALERTSFLMQTSGGTAGRDEEMVKLIEEIDQLLTKNEYK